MDTAIRAANWSIALHGFAGAPGVPAAFSGRVLRALYEAGLFLERHLEWHPVYRGNHYVANGVGLVYVGTLFRDAPDGARWLRLGSRILREEMDYQVGPDGVSFEGSLAYHRLVTELFAYGGELMRANLPGGVTARYEAALRRMYAFVATYLPPGGEAPMLGDADDGRLHAVSARGLLEPRRHALGLPERYWPEAEPAAAALPHGGFFVLRGGGHHAVVRCGNVGIRGAGSHDHNDQLAVELVLGGRRVLADSGTYAYTRDLQARHAFRSTASHGVVQVGGEEQNPIRADRPWRVLEDRTRSRCLEWLVGPDVQVFTGEHRGFAHRGSGAVCRRSVRLHPDEGCCEIVDVVEGSGVESIAWRLHFDRGSLRLLRVEEGVHTFAFDGDPVVLVALHPPAGLMPVVVTGRASDRYGEVHERPVLLVEGHVELPVTIHVRFRLAAPDDPSGDDAR
jgi:hypothetical protein